MTSTIRQLLKRGLFTGTLCLLATLSAVTLAPGVLAQTEDHHGPGHSPVDAIETAEKANRLTLDRFNPASDTLHLFGHTRQRLTYIDNLLFGEELEEGDWFYTHRYFLGGEYQTQHFRLLGEVSAAFVEDALEGNSPVEENQLAVQRLWFEADLIETGSKTLAVRVGRDEWKLGSQRLVGWRDGTNVRRRFDGVRFFYHDTDWSLQLLGGFEVENDTGVFDDDIAGNRALWGLYGTRSIPFGLPGSIDIYYLGFYDDSGRALEATGRETRHSIGGRLWGHRHGWDWNIEGVYQFGDFDITNRAGDEHSGPDSLSISAWTVASIIGYRFEHLPLKPRLALSTNIASGDSDPADAKLGSFNALFPRGSYFSELAQLGPRNFYNFNPYLTLELKEGLEWITDFNLFWRQSLADGVYGPPGNLVRAPEGSNARLVNAALSTNLEYQVSEQIFVGALYTHSMPRAFIRETDPDARAVDFIELTFRFDF